MKYLHMNNLYIGMFFITVSGCIIKWQIKIWTNFNDTYLLKSK